MWIHTWFPIKFPMWGFLIGRKRYDTGFDIEFDMGNFFKEMTKDFTWGLIWEIILNN